MHITFLSSLYFINLLYSSLPSLICAFDIWPAAEMIVFVKPDILDKIMYCSSAVEFTLCQHSKLKAFNCKCFVCVISSELKLNLL